MYKVEDVSKIIIDTLKCDEEFTVTNLMLNKLLYFAQAHHLAKFGTPLFEEEIEAWDLGPVISKVYHTYKPYSSGSIILTDKVNYDLKGQDLEFLSNLLMKYGEYSANRLVKLTHNNGTPWQTTYDKNNKNKVIPKEKMKDYYSTHEVLEDWEKPKNTERVTKLPKEWYDSGDDAIWEEEYNAG